MKSRLGDTASLVRTLTHKDIEVFAIMSGDVNPAHVDESFAKSDMFHKVVAQGMWGASLISTVLGTELPGPGTIYIDQSLHFLRPVGLGDTITVSVKVATKFEESIACILDCQAINQLGEEVIDGTAEVIAPTEKISRPRVVLPEIELREKGRRYRQLIEMTRGLDPIRTAVVHPVDTVSLLGAVEAARVEAHRPGSRRAPKTRSAPQPSRPSIDLSALRDRFHGAQRSGGRRQPSRWRAPARPKR